MFGGCLLICCILGGTSVWTYENIALNKPAWQQNSSFGFSAGRAVDGRKESLSIFGSDCVLTDYNFATEWRVDLGTVLSMHHIFIQYATDNKPWDENNSHIGHFLGFSVYISNTTNKEDGILCFRDTKYTRATIPNPINITCPYYGRYVIYYNNRTHYPLPVGYSKDTGSNLCEVEVYGCSDQGKFGENCSMSCPTNCLKSRCDITKGTCFECIVGYLGPTCETGSSTAWIKSKNSATWMEGESSTAWINSENTTTRIEVKEKRAQYAVVYVFGAVGVIVIVVNIAIFVLKRRNKNCAETRRSCCLRRSRGNTQFSPEDEIAPQNLSTQMVQVHSEDLNTNENNYSEPFETVNNLRRAQSQCSFGDQDDELNIYSYNHLHEKPLQMVEDIYDVAMPICRSPVPSNNI
uniref:Uncharacterized protein LOC111102273 n=1 Tax=Crassostrea virginica TaxID=6565 RepID=A0A8B8AKT2_CRAVI|nr:uncharacterized protein LOC111102273 [Crassostrea virginica]